ncbi:ABC transporter permease [Clostridium sp. Marseille-P299]|uniref:ABC transporter permease n=1 Tax=Clostridium sp. Marseille-P299 TaxID=1805477 RepID=UPI000835049F|nr:FtsX-like permease family protein [Clostridium sp. Marseille-P299]
MRISDLIKMGLRNLGRRKARTSLTVIGMVIGTISIVVMVSIGIGVNKSFNDAIIQNGSMTIITISKNQYYETEDGNWASKEQKLDDSVVEQIKGIKHVKSVSPIYQAGVQFMSGKYYSWGNIIAMDSSTFKDFGMPEISEGTMITPEENNVIIFGSQSLYEFSYYSGRTRKTKTVELGKDKLTFSFQDYQVNDKKKPLNVKVDKYGLLQESTNWQYNYNIYMDIEYYKSIYKKYASTLKIEDRKKAMASLENYQTIQINVDSMKNVTQVQDEIEAMGYKTTSDMQYLEGYLETADMLQMVLGAIGGIAMLVSAINIANTMVMSIYERTKEIGIMKVLGCLVKDVKKLFLFEAGIIGLIGGIIGIGFSYLASYFINKYGGSLLGSLVGNGGMYGDNSGAQFSQIPIWLPFVAALFSILVGVISGYFPARRATKISAIEAMKTEN